MRLRLTLLSLCLLGSLLVAGAASANLGTAVLDQGIVQSVSPTQLVLRALDGSTVAITIGPRTRVFLNGKPAPVTAIQPGYIASALHDDGRPAFMVRAVGRIPITADRGVIVAVSATSLSLRTGRGGIVTLAVDGSTRVELNGRPASLADLRPGYAAEVTHRGTDAALTIRARGRRNAQRG